MINAIMQDHAGDMWLGTEGDGLFLVQNGKDSFPGAGQPAGQ